MVTSILGMAAPAVFRLLEKRFGPKTGATKMEVASDVFGLILDRLAAAGKLGAAAPAKDELKTLLEKLLADEKTKADWHEQGLADVAGRRFVIEIISEVK